MAHPARFERATSAFGGQRSIQLSYGCSRQSAGAHHRQARGLRQWPEQTPTSPRPSPPRRGGEGEEAASSAALSGSGRERRVAAFAVLSDWPEPLRAILLPRPRPFGRGRPLFMVRCTARGGGRRVRECDAGPSSETERATGMLRAFRSAGMAPARPDMPPPSPSAPWRGVRVALSTVWPGRL